MKNNKGEYYLPVSYLLLISIKEETNILKIATLESSKGIIKKKFFSFCKIKKIDIFAIARENRLLSSLKLFKGKYFFLSTKQKKVQICQQLKKVEYGINSLKL